MHDDGLYQKASVSYLNLGSYGTSWEEKMKRFAATVAALILFAVSAQAQSDKPGMKPETAPGAAEKGAGAAGIAKDPGEVKAQQGDTSKMSPGTVGAAPGADAKSQGGK